MEQDRLRNLRVYPETAAERQRFLELEQSCRELLTKLSSEERRIFQEYAALRDRQEDRRLLEAYQSGIQVGIRRAEREKRK